MLDILGFHHGGTEAEKLNIFRGWKLNNGYSLSTYLKEIDYKLAYDILPPDYSYWSHFNCISKSGNLRNNIPLWDRALVELTYPLKVHNYKLTNNYCPNLFGRPGIPQIPLLIQNQQQSLGDLISLVVHEIGHCLAASPERLKDPEFGFGTEITGDAARDEELFARISANYIFHLWMPDLKFSPRRKPEYMLVPSCMIRSVFELNLGISGDRSELLDTIHKRLELRYNR